MADDTTNLITGGIFFSTVIQGRDITVQLPAQVPSALSGIPVATSAFSGRSEELQALLHALAPTSEGNNGEEPGVATVPVVAVSGLAGIGKTELAKQAARAAMSHGWFPGGVLFVDMFGYDDARRVEPAQALDGFLRALGIPGEHIPPSAQDRSRLYSSVLSAYARQGQRVLVLLDNISTHEQATLLLPTDRETGVVITSRHTLAMLGARLIDLDVLVNAEGVELLRRTLTVTRPGDTRIINYPGDAARIVQLCGGLPLALRISAAILAADTARPLAALVTDLSDASSRLEELHYEDTGVRAAFGLSYARLDAEHARLFRLIAVNPGPDLSTRAAAALAGNDEAMIRRGLASLARAHLLGPGSVSGRWQMHDLVRLYADELSNLEAKQDRRDESFTRLLDHYLSTARAANAQLDPRATDAERSRFSDRGQALAWLDAEYPNLTAATYAASTGGSNVAVARDLPRAIFDFLLWRRYFDDWITLSHTALDAARRLGDLNGQAGALISLGIALREVDRFKGAGRSEEAIAILEDAARIFRDIGDLNGEATALVNMGGALQEVERSTEAINILTEAVRLFRDTSDPHGEARALLNLGLAQEEANLPEDAITTNQAAARMFRDNRDWWNSGQALNNLGRALRQTGRFEEAITAHHTAEQIYRDADTRWGVGQVLADMATALWEAGQLNRAIAALQDAARIFHATADEYSERRALAELETRQQARNLSSGQEPG